MTGGINPIFLNGREAWGEEGGKMMFRATPKEKEGSSRICCGKKRELKSM